MLLFLLETYNSLTSSLKPFVAVPANLVFIFGSFLSVLNVISEQNHLNYFLCVIHTVAAQAAICILCECLNSNAIFGENKLNSVPYLKMISVRGTFQIMIFKRKKVFTV